MPFPQMCLSLYLRDDEISEIIESVCALADMDTTNEVPTAVRDEEMDALILAARRIRDREGFTVVEGDDA